MGESADLSTSIAPSIKVKAKESQWNKLVAFCVGAERRENDIGTNDYKTAKKEGMLEKKRTHNGVAERAKEKTGAG